MGHYKLSVFNVRFTRDNKNYLWNTFSNALIRLDQSAIQFIDNFSGEETDHPYFKVLFQNGCIVTDCLDEFGKILYDEKAITFNRYPKRLNYTIAPGLSCNYHCEYCFENHRTSFEKMSLEVEESLFQFFCRQIKNNSNLDEICITWFGGEPLLYVDIIDRISKRLVSHCREHGIKYHAGMISNGRFLTKENVQILRDNQIDHIQISLDGMPEHYAKIKNASVDDFYQTVNNIVYACDYMHIAVRINILDSLTDAVNLTDYLLKVRNLDGKIKVYVAHTRLYDDNLSVKEEHKSHQLFLKNEGNFIQLFGKAGIYNKNSFEYRKPQRRGTTCLSVCHHNACIGPNGEIYRCEHHFGMKDAIVGNIYNGLFFQANDLAFFSFQHRKKCLRCKFFPVCLGGCLDDAINQRDIIDCRHYCERLIDLKMFEIEH